MYMHEIYTTYAAPEQHLTVRIDAACYDGHIEPLGSTGDNFPIPEDLDTADNILAERGYRRISRWTRTRDGDYCAHVDHD